MRHLILGNGPAGVVAAETLRRVAPADDILLVGNEDEPPYSRMAIPYLLEGNIDEAGTYLRKMAGHFASLRIEQRRGRVVAVNPEKSLISGKMKRVPQHPAPPKRARLGRKPKNIIEHLRGSMMFPRLSALEFRHAD